MLNTGGWAHLRRYLTRTGVIAAVRIGMYDHSGVTIYPVADGDGHHVLDGGGWDSGTVGFAFVTRKRWDELMGDMDPREPVDGTVDFALGRVAVQRERVMQAIYDEIAEYDSFQKGEVYGYTVTRPHCDDDECPHAEVLDSCWGYVGELDYCRTEARRSAESLSEPPDNAHERLHREMAGLRGAEGLGPMHPAAALIGSNVPAHIPGAYPNLSCCSGPDAPVQLVPEA